MLFRDVPRIALHVICQDNLELVREQLGAMAPYVDVMRYCDGGSTDGTLELLRGKECPDWQVRIGFQRFRVHGAPIYVWKRRWDDNYAAQDNLLLSKARVGEWILMMDSDELPSPPLRKHLREIVAEAEELGHDMLAIPSLLVLDGQPEAPVETYVEEVLRGARHPFLKHWLFRYDRRVRSFGQVHRELRRRLKTKDAFGNIEYGDDWARGHLPYPYFHFKTTFGFALNDVLQAWIDPAGSGYTLAQEQEMRFAVQRTWDLNKQMTSRELHQRLKAGVQKYGGIEGAKTLAPIWQFASRYQNEKGAIRNWYMVLKRYETNKGD